MIWCDEEQMPVRQWVRRFCAIRGVWAERTAFRGSAVEIGAVITPKEKHEKKSGAG